MNIMIKPAKLDWMVAITLFLTMFALFIPHRHHGLSLWDEGVHIYAAKRVYDGQVPYRDFRLVYGPARYYLQALLFRVLGLTVSTGKIYMILTLAFASMTTYLLARQIKIWAPLSILCSFLILHNATSLLFIPTFDRILWAFLSLLPVMSYLNNGKKKNLFFAGILSGFTFLIGHETGLCVIGTIAMTLLIKFIITSKKSEQGENTLIEFLVFGAGALGVAGLFLGYLAREGALSNYFFDAFQRYSRFGSSYLAMGQKVILPALKSLFIISNLRDSLYAHRFYGLMSIYLATLYFLFYRKDLIKTKDTSYLKVLMLTLFGISIFYIPLSRYLRYYVLLVLPPGLILSAYFFQKMIIYLAATVDKKILRTKLLQTISIVIILYLSVHYLSSFTAFIHILSYLQKCQAWSVNLDRATSSFPPYKETEINEAFPFKNKEEFLATIGYITKNTSENSKIFVASHDTMFYFLTKRDNATKFDLITELYLTPESKIDQEDIIKDLIKEKASYVIFSNIVAYWGDRFRTSKEYMEKLMPEVYNFIIKNYQFEKDISYFEFWGLKNK